MKHTSILCIAAIALAGIFCSCNKENSEKKYSVDIELTFETTQDVANMVTRQYEVYTPAGLIGSKNITGEKFTDTFPLLNLVAPTTFDVKCFAAFSGSQVPDVFKFKNSYKITASTDKGFCVTEVDDTTRDLTPEQVESNIQSMNYTIHYTLDEDGKITKTIEKK